MNIYYLSHETDECAKLYYDIHVRKNILEIAQILCTVRHRYSLPSYYQLTHKNRSYVIWAGDSKENYTWLCKLGLSLSKEYLYRFGKVHKSVPIIVDCFYSISDIMFPKEVFYEPPLLMNECYKLDTTIASYIQYYKYGKMHLKNYTKRECPTIFKEI